MRNLILFALVLAPLAGCRGDSGNNNPTPDAPDTSGGTKIQDIQNDAMPSGTAVTLKGVVVTAIDNYGTKKGDVWVEEPGGGPFSGIHVFGAPLDQVAALAVGDVINVAGAQKDEFVYSGTNGVGGFPAGYGITELKPVTGGAMTLTKTGANTPITPDAVNALTIGQITDQTARDAEWEKWEGVLITLSSVAATSSPKCVGSGCTDATLQSFKITGGAVVESSLGPMPTPAIKSGDCLASVTGPLDYFFDYEVLPRDVNNDGTTEDFALGGANCPVPENSPALCADGMDNDGNGFTDCADNGCVVALASCRMADNAIIADIQAGMTTGNVRIQSSIVMAISFDKKDVWISASKNATINEGIDVHFNAAVASSIAVGKTVEVIGNVVEFNDSMGTGTLTEITGYSITASGANAQTPMALPGAAATLNNDTTGEPYESVLVTITNAKITTAADSMYHVGAMTSGTTVFEFDDTIARLTNDGTVNTCYPSISGIWTYDVYNNKWEFFPIDKATATGTGC